MSPDGPNFQETWLWQQAFPSERSDCSAAERRFFQDQYLSLRKRVKQLASRVAVDMPGMTVHDISHADALWEMASLVAEGAVDVSPVETFVLGASFLLHDAAMTIAAYPDGASEVKNTTEWRDAIAGYALWADENGRDTFDRNDPPDTVVQAVMPKVLRRLHAKQAEVLATQAWVSSNHEQVYLIEDSELRKSYGQTIGRIAHSHWWPVDKLQDQFQGSLGGLASRTRATVDSLKLACLLRVADALHLDSRRAPSFLQAITRPAGESSLHWSFQALLARPYLESDAVVFTSGQPFSRADAESWWLAYEMINIANQELQDVNILLQNLGKSTLKARRIAGAGSPSEFCRKIPTHGWRPVETRIRVSDALRVVKILGGKRLYGDDPTIALRELIQNAADAIHARRKIEPREKHWGKIVVRLTNREDGYWLEVEDNGIGMSSQVLTGPLLDFGMSFWRSPMAMEQFPGLMASGLRPIGRFGIGFFAVFMLGSVVRVYSRRYDQGRVTGHLLEFHDGTAARPILSSDVDMDCPRDGGTRVELRLKNGPRESNGILSISRNYSRESTSLSRLVASIAPNLDVTIYTEIDGKKTVAIEPEDWLQIAGHKLIERINLDRHSNPFRGSESSHELMQVISSTTGTIYGRAYIKPSVYLSSSDVGCMTIDGFRATNLSNVDGILLGEATTAVRDVALPTVPHEDLARWSSAQARLISCSIQDEERQAKSAEIVLVCGGDISNLKIVRWGSEWLDTTEFVSRIGSRYELTIGFYDEFEYDEDLDDLAPREFRDNFVPDSDVLMVPKYRGWIVRIGRQNWPESSLGLPESVPSRLAEFIRGKIAETWGVEIEGVEIERQIGRVGDTKVIRSMTTFVRSIDSNDD